MAGDFSLERLVLVQQPEAVGKEKRRKGEKGAERERLDTWLERGGGGGGTSLPSC